MSNEVVRVAIRTGEGIIEVDIELGRAPVTAANFLRYLDQGYYDGTSFYRTVKPSNQPDNLVKIEVIQGGPGMAQLTEGQAKFPPIELERTSLTGLRHADGTISMARLTPDSATSEFFICLEDQPELDFGGRRNADGQGFAAFGRVSGGYDVVRRIQHSPADGQNLTPPIKIERIERSG